MALEDWRENLTGAPAASLFIISIISCSIKHEVMQLSEQDLELLIYQVQINPRAEGCCARVDSICTDRDW